MITETRPFAEITAQAISVLCKEIGVVNTVRFINQFSVGYRDYTEEREQLFGRLTLGEIVNEIKKNRERPA